jgi:hypothetical protein
MPKRERSHDGLLQEGLGVVRVFGRLIRHRIAEWTAETREDLGASLRDVRRHLEREIEDPGPTGDRHRTDDVSPPEKKRVGDADEPPSDG